MTVKELSEIFDCQIICMPDGDREISGGYAGDLLSWVIGRASSGNVWVTIMSNMNIVAVASLSDIACILLSENVDLDDDSIRERALSQGINILKTKMDTFSACEKLSKII